MSPAWAAALRLPQRPLVAAGAGAAFVALLLQLGGNGSYQFIYFQF